MTRFTTIEPAKRLLAQGVTGIAIVAILILHAAGSASAHAGLASSDPAPNAIVPTAPAAVTMTFTEPLERTYSKAELYDQDGNLVDGTSVSDGESDNAMVLQLPPDLPNGTYSVLWRTLSTADGHTAQNYVAFTVGTAADVAATAGPDTTGTGPPLWVQTASRWLALVGLSASIAAWPMWLLVLRPALGSARHVARTATRRMQRFTAGAVAVAILGNLFAIAVQAAALADGTLLERIRSTLGDTRYGELWYLRVALLLALALTLQWVAWWWPRRNPIPTVLALVLSAAAATPFSYIAHASALGEGRDVAIFADILHILSASLWTGGILVLIVVLVPIASRLDAALRRQVLSSVLPRFSTLALIAWATLTLTGVYAAWLHVGGRDALLHTAYGKTLVVKLAILIPILLLAAFNLLVVTSRLRTIAGDPVRIRTWSARFGYAVATEVLLAIAVLAAVGALTAQAPARETFSPPTASTEVAFSDGDHDADLTISPGTPGPNAFTLTLSGEPLLHTTEVVLRVSSTEQDTGEKDLRFTHSDGSEFAYEGSELSLAGAWDLQLMVRQPSAPEWRAYGSVDLTTGTAMASKAPSWVLSGASATGGILLVLAGLTALAVSWQRRPRHRLSVAVLGAVVLIVGAVALVSARTDIEHVARLAIGLF